MMLRFTFSFQPRLTLQRGSALLGITAASLLPSCGLSDQKGERPSDARDQKAKDEGCGSVGDLRPCSEGGQKGKCAEGFQSCREDRTWSACTVQPVDPVCGSTEDNDCDGEPDDESDACECLEGEQRPCNTDWGDVGMCDSGMETCVSISDGSGTVWDGICAGQVAPAPRVCGEASDNDCDGARDNEHDEECQCDPGSVQSCGELDPTLDGVGACASGTQTCVASDDRTRSSWSECVDMVLPANPDCDSWNDLDCDGVGDYFACATEIAAGLGHACFINSLNEVRCWGCTSDLPPDDDEECSIYRTSPDKFDLGASTPEQISAGHKNGCVLLSDGLVSCFSYQTTSSALLQGANGGEAVPMGQNVAPVQGLAAGASVTNGKAHACSLLKDETVWCWGANSNGQLGRAEGSDCAEKLWYDCGGLPAAAVEGVPMVVDVDAGLWHTCAVTKGGAVLCWGRNESGQLGSGNLSQSATPVAVDGVTAAQAVAAGRSHSCALLDDGTLTCWGKVPGLGNSPIATPVPELENVISVSAIGDWTCYLLQDGASGCLNESGTEFSFSSSERAVDTITAGGEFACGRLGGKVICRTASAPFPSPALRPYFTDLSYFANDKLDAALAPGDPIIFD